MRTSVPGCTKSSTSLADVNTAAVTIVVPCFNEGTRIAGSLATLEAWFGPGLEILVIDDGSRDDTYEQAQLFAHARRNVRVHRLDRHRGKGAAIRAAIPLVRTDLVAYVDADLAFDRSSLEAVVRALDDADVAVGNRRHEGSYYLVPVRLFWFLYRRHLLGLLFNAAVRAIFGLHLRDTQCGLKGYRRPFLQRMAPALSVDGFAIDVEILVLTSTMGARLAEVPVQVRYESAKSSVSMAVSGWLMLSDLARIAVRRARGEYTRLSQVEVRHE